MQPDAEPTREAYDGALLVAGFIRDAHLIRTFLVSFKNGAPDPVDDG